MGTPLRVLLVEDTEDDALFILRELRSGGFEPTWKRVDTEPALTAALVQENWDLITCDWVMPQFSAPAALELIREDGFNGPIIIISGQVGEEVAVTAMKAGAHDYVSKHNLTRLIPAVERELSETNQRRARKRAEAALRESEERFELAAEGSNDGMWDWDIYTGRIWSSRRLYELVGYEEGEIDATFSNGIELLHPDDRTRMLEAMRAHLQEHVPFDIEFQLQTKSRGYRWFRVRAQALWDENGAAVRMAGSIRDVTERKEVEEKLRASEERFRLLAENARDVIFRYRIQPEPVLEYMSPAVIKMTGYTPEEFYADAALPLKLVHPDDRAHLKSIQREIQEAPDRPIVTRFIRKDGVVVWTEHQYVTVRDESGAIVATEGISRDITERKRAEEALHQSQERFRTSLESMLDCFGIYSAIRDKRGCILDFRVEYVNAAACANNRMTKEEQLGGRLLELFPAHRESGLFDEYCQVVETGVPVQKESLLYEDVYGNERLLRAFDIRAGRLGDGFVAAWRDITVRKRAEAETQQLKADLDRRVRERTAELEATNKELESFSHSVSHDLRAPLRAIDGFSLALLEDYAGQLDEQGQTYLRRVWAGAQRMGQLIDGLLMLSRLTRADIHRQPVDLTAEARMIVAELQRTQPDRQVTFVIGDGGFAHGDLVLKQALFS